jgi:hypothetical protein
VHFTYFSYLYMGPCDHGLVSDVPYLTRAGLLAVLIVVGGQVLVVRTPAQHVRLDAWTIYL